MRKILVLILFVMLAGFTTQAQSLTGRYRLSDNGDIYIYVFSGDSTLTIFHGKDSMVLTYSVDTTQTPYHLNFQKYDSEGVPAQRAPGIYEWVGKDKIRIRFSNNMMVRPKGFMPKGNNETILLVREKK